MNAELIGIAGLVIGAVLAWLLVRTREAGSRAALEERAHQLQQELIRQTDELREHKARVSRSRRPCAGKPNCAHSRRRRPASLRPCSRRISI